MSSKIYGTPGFIRKHTNASLFVIGFAIIGAISLLVSHAGSPSANQELENTVLTNCAAAIDDSTASNSKAIEFGGTSCSQTTQTVGAGAHLPINYDPSSLTGTVRYVATTGSDTTGTGSLSAPYATLAKAISASGANNTIVVRGGVYRNQANMEIIGSTKNGLKIIAYPGETPEFNDAQKVSNASGWTTEGAMQYHSYQPRPLTDASAVAFSNESSMQNLTGDGAGRYADQVWIGNNPLDQVKDKSSLLTEGHFYVDRVNNRLYMMATDVAKDNIETSAPRAAGDRAIYIYGATNVTIEGIRFTRYSASAIDYGVVSIGQLSSGITLRNIEVSQAPFDAVSLGVGVDNAKVEHITVSYAGWKGLQANQTDKTVFDAVKVSNVDPFDEFSGSPVSGALKTSRTRDMVVKNSLINNNKSHGLWFDQSNINVTVANNTITDNDGAGVFFEISDGLLLINNYIKASGSAQAVKLAGSSGLKLINNTILGGKDPIGIYTDGRSSPGCAADITKCLPGASTYSSERQGRFSPPPITMDWMPRIDLMLNNIVAYPSGAGLCAITALCITTYHNLGASAPIETIIHKADTARGIPQTQINGNVYVNIVEDVDANGVKTPPKIIRVSKPTANYMTVSAFTTAMGISPVSIPGIDLNSKYGASWVNADGSPTSALSAAYSQAFAIPVDANMNLYIPAGYQHYGVTYK